jgi:putative ABC transport system permease protein
MGLNALDRKLWRDLWHIRGQVLAIAFVIGCGVATLVLSLGTLNSLEETRDAYYERYRFADVFANVKRAPQSLLDDISQIPDVSLVEGRIVHEVILDIPNMPEPARGRVVSLPSRTGPHLNDIVLRVGRMPRTNSTDEIIVHEAFAEAHEFQPGDTFKANLNERQQELIIVGIALSPEYVYVLGPGDLAPDNRRFGVFWMNRNALEALYDLKGAFNEASLRLAHNGNEAAAIIQVDRLIDRYGGIGAFGREDQLSYAFLKSEMDQLATLASILPPIFLAVAAFLLNLVIDRLIQTEREQIGLLKAFGYHDLEVGWHYFKFVAVIVALGVVIGWGAGVWLGRGMTEMYSEFFRFPFLYYIVEPSVFAIGAVVSLLAASIGTITAVRRAVRLAPAIAMTPPPPTTYRITLVERIGMTYAMSQPARMILRHIVRWPLRSALTVIGISFSGALLVTTLFFLDALDEMTETYFFETARQDVSIVLTDIRSDIVIEEIARLPSVMNAEGVRQVPVRLHLGTRSERSVITGLAPESDLQQLMSDTRQPIDVPPLGLMLTEKLASMMDAKAGDTIRVDVLEGRRPTIEIPVTKIAQQYIGIGAYMNRTALNRLLKEGPVVSLVHVQADRAQEAELFAALKEIPALLGLMIKRTSLESFYDTVRKHLDTTIAAYIGFASVIAIGVIYNAARISLSERARELASLRVLGFTQREVAFILAGELGILTWAALPLSALFGYLLAAVMVDQFDTELFRLPFVIHPATYGYAILVVIFSAAISAWAVIRRVANLDLVAVLKTRE